MVVTDACRFLKHATALWVRRGGEDAVRVQAWSVVVDRFLSHAVDALPCQQRVRLKRCITNDLHFAGVENINRREAQ